MSISSSSRRQVPITNLGLEYEAIREKLTPTLENIFRTGAFVLGPELAQFEKELARYIGCSFAVGVNSGTDAILLALRALGIGAGDEVIVPAMSFFATVEPVVLLGAKPVFVDIEPGSLTIHPAQIEKAITPQTKAIIAVHLYGLPADLKVVSAIAKKAKIALIEDLAQAIGSECEGKRIGSWGDIACLSFYPTKNLGACGDGGAVMTSSPEMAERLKSLRNHGTKRKYYHEESAYNTRLDDIQAAILRLKLTHLDAWTEKRRTFAALYSSLLKGLPISLPQEQPGRKHVYHLYSIQSDQRDALKEFLEKEGISTGLHYPLALHLLPALKHLGHKENSFPESEKLARRTLSLPLFPFMKSDDVHYVAEAVKRFYSQQG